MADWMGRERRENLTQSAGVVDVSGSYNRAGAAIARQNDQIAGVLDQTAGQVLKLAKTEDKLRGEEAGQTEALIRGPDGKLAPPTLDQSALLSGGESVRRQVLASRYGSEFVLENTKALTDLRAASGTDPEAFLLGARAHTQGVTSAMPGALRGPVTEGIQRETMRHYRSMVAERFDADRKGAMAAGEQVYLNNVRDVSTALAADPAAAPGMQAGALAQIDGMVAAGLLDPGKAAGMRRQIDTILPMQTQLRREHRTGGGSSSSGGGLPASGVPYVAPNLPQGVDAPTDQLVRTVLGEAGGEDDRGKLAVAHVVLTRAKVSGTSVTDVIFAKNQFEPWGNAQTRARLEAIDPASPKYQAALKLVQAAQTGVAPDPTGGATHFYAPKAQAQLGRDAPKWDDGKGVDLGNHRFFRQSYAGRSGGGGVEAAAAPAGEDGPTRAMATAQALIAGPGTPGFRPEWNALRADERLDMAQGLVQSARLERSESDHVRVQSARVDTERSAAIVLRMAQIERFGDEPGSTGLTPELRAERTKLEGELTVISTRQGNTTAATQISRNTTSDRQMEARRGQDATAQFSIAASLTTLAGNDATGSLDDNPIAQEEYGRIAHLPLPAQAQELSRRVGEVQRDTKIQNERREAVAEFVQGMRGEGRLKDNATNQTLVLEGARQQGNGDALSPAGMGVLVQGARAGVVPPRIVTGMAQAMQPGADIGQLMQMTQLHTKMTADPLAEREWVKTIDPRLNLAFEYLKNRLPGMDLKSKEGMAEVNVVRANAAKIASGVKLWDDAKAALGPDASNLIDGAVAGAAGMPVAGLPPRMREKLNAAVLEGVVAGFDVTQSASIGLRMLQAREGWGQSRFGASIMPQPDSRTDVGRVLDGDFFGERPARWVQHPPEMHVAPFGAGGEVGSKWISERMRDLAKDYKLPNATLARPGRDLVLRVDDDPGAPKGIDGKPTYQLHYEKAGIWHSVRQRDANGVETAAPLRLDLAAEAAEHKKRWEAPGGGFDQLRARHGNVAEMTQDQRRQALLGNPTDSLNPIELPNPRAGRGR